MQYDISHLNFLRPALSLVARKAQQKGKQIRVLVRTTLMSIWRELSLGFQVFLFMYILYIFFHVSQKACFYFIVL